VQDEGILIYMKTVLCGDEPTDLLRFNSLDEQFPHDPASDQFYDETRVEAYRQLGEHIGNKVSAALPVGDGIQGWSARGYVEQHLGRQASDPSLNADAAIEGELPTEVSQSLKTLADTGVPVEKREQAALSLASVEGCDARIVDVLLDALFAESDQRFQKTCQLVLCERLTALARALPGRFADPAWQVRQHCVMLVEHAVMLADHIEPVLQTLRELVHQIVEPALQDKSARVRESARSAAQTFCVEFRREAPLRDVVDELRCQAEVVGRTA
jgi:hypothetical protein